MSQTELNRRWQLILGVQSESENSANDVLSAQDQRILKSLNALYGAIGNNKTTRTGLNRSRPNLAKWLGEIREFFPTSVVQVIQQDAFQHLGLNQMLLEPELLEVLEADVHLVANLMTLRDVIPEHAIDAARQVIQKVVEELMRRLQSKTAEAIRGALNKSQKTFRPRFADIDWHRTISANLRHYQPEQKTIVLEKLIGHLRRNSRLTDIDEVILCVDQSASMATSVIYSSIFAAVMASIPTIKTYLICFDTQVLDYTQELSDPISILFGLQLGGGTDINQAIAYCESKIQNPRKTHLILISDLYEGGNATNLVRRIGRLIHQGVNVISLLALSDDGRPAYDSFMARQFLLLGAPVFSCTPDHFPDLMAAALKRQDLVQWASKV